LKISIITPALNRVKYLPECIESVLGQGYGYAEHVIVDGGSMDGTVEFLQSATVKYGDRIKWISQPDRGMSHAVNRGFKMASGDVIGWMGADDKLAKGTLSTVASYFAKNPAAFWLYGSFVIVDDQGNAIRNMRAKPFDRKRFLRTGYICGPSVFSRAELARKVGPVREDLKYAMDFEWYLRMAAIAQPHKLDAVLAYFSWHPGSITMDQRLAQLDEALRFSLPFASSPAERGILILSNKFYKLRAWARRLPRHMRVLSWSRVICMTLWHP
jgi:glycosyltransferase involved in cell wall biosynthesis